ncbi:MAG: alpha/beta fold hydrolase [Proteobacteria bacterium]|nr:alpha/beta fold hydrolase [Pseudomonadota bacterium]MBU4469645.1 alpha/beta fold hydrolase [Pseudomonadota bacterium]MCG2751728.1 alpha/beta fold hydrolase [Desulfobacteraceae bacterium]
MQNKFLYFPSSEKPSPRMLESKKMILWQMADGDYRGITTAMEQPAPNGTIVLFHGNGGIALDRGFYMAPLNKLGFRVILAEYPGYGGRPGKVGEKAFVADGLETIKRVHEQYGEPVYLLGESLGCGVAAAISQRSSTPIAGIILITPWDTLAAVAKSLFPILPLQLILTDKYDTIGNLASFQGKISVVGAEHDEVLPIRHAHHLFASLPEGKKSMWVIRGAGHNDWPFYAEESLFKDVTDFVKVGSL